ncbi:MAG TPA: D-arabinono-1,4-lactone oxidase, partial [Acidimicrobiales bacterium]|nr:D-arabinono-1,4-lactone oxidase [Acidimicrobiales bacterium]
MVGAATWSNWAGTETARHAAAARPAATDEVAAVIRAAGARGQRVKALGAGHSFTGIAVTDGVAVDLARLAQVRSVDTATGLVTVGAGIRLHRLCEVLEGFGLAMANMGDIAVQTLAGAIATGTHGTGARLGGLATQVVGLELVTADGRVHTCSADTEPELFAAARVGLGALGVVTAVTLQAVPAFRLHAQERTEPLDDVLAGLDAAADRVEHFEAYWVPHTSLARTKRNARTDEPPRGNGRITHLVERELLENVAFGAVCRLERRLPSLCRRLAPVVAAGGSRDFVDRSDRVFTSPRRVHFKEMEYALARADLATAVERLRAVVDGDPTLHVAFPVEIRVAAA